MASAAGIGTEIRHRRGLCVAFLVRGLARILEEGRPAVRGLLQESLERNGRAGIKQTIYPPKIVERFGSELTATPIYCGETVAGLHGFTETELRQAQHVG